MRKDFYIFRHGQTDYNVEKRWAGRDSDVSLNDRGIEQAEELGENLCGLGIEVIFSSNLIRAKHTAEIVAKTIGVEVKIKPEFHEGNFGVGEGRLLSELGDENPKLREDWNNLAPEFMDIRYPNGESKREIQERMFGALRDIANENYSVMGVASHGAAIRYLLMAFGIVLEKIPNGKPFHLLLENGEWSCELPS